MRYLIAHETRLVFPRAVREHQCELRLVPRDDAHQTVVYAQVAVSPESPLGSYEDCFGNRVHSLSLLEPHDELVTILRAEVETRLANPFDFTPLPARSERAWLAQRLREEPRLVDFVLHRSECVPELAKHDLALELPAHDAELPLLENVQAAMDWASRECAYESGATDVHHPLLEVLEKRAGVCQDFAHLVIAIVRGWGFAARYVMGFLDPAPDESASPDGVRAPHDAATHAWAEVLVPGAGWRGFDATRALLADDRYVAVAVGRDSRDAAPLRGSFKGQDGGSPPRVHVQVQRQD